MVPDALLASMVVPAGPGVKTLAAGDRVLVSCVSACGRCRFCRLVATRQVDAARFITHHFALGDIIGAYDAFARAADTGAIKVVMTRS